MQSKVRSEGGMPNGLPRNNATWVESLAKHYVTEVAPGISAAIIKIAPNNTATS